MTFSLPDSALFGSLYGATGASEVFSDTARAAVLFEVEGAVARAAGRLGLIPSDAAARISAAAMAVTADMERLRASVAVTGLPVTGVVDQLRDSVSAADARYVHWGATSQDILDTALVLQLRQAAQGLIAQLEAIIGVLADLAGAHRDTLMAARTHARHAVPMTFGLKVSAWLSPLIDHRERFDAVARRLYCVQLGGAAGTLAAYGGKGLAMNEALADELELAVPPLPWHAQRERIADFGHWLALISASLGKAGQDIVLLSQTEVAEVRESVDPDRGRSSTMPQKQNPVLSEVLIASARMNANLMNGLYQAMIAEQERATHGWQLEWMVLPQMIACTGAALDRGQRLFDGLIVDTQRMRDNVAMTRGQLLAEAAVFALSDRMPRPEAQALVRQACRDADGSGRDLFDVLPALVNVAIDWSGVACPENYLGMSFELVENTVRRANALTGKSPR